MLVHKVLCIEINENGDVALGVLSKRSDNLVGVLHVDLCNYFTFSVENSLIGIKICVADNVTAVGIEEYDTEAIHDLNDLGVCNVSTLGNGEAHIAAAAHSARLCIGVTLVNTVDCLGLKKEVRVLCIGLEAKVKNITVECGHRKLCSVCTGSARSCNCCNCSRDVGAAYVGLGLHADYLGNLCAVVAALICDISVNTCAGSHSDYCAIKNNVVVIYLGGINAINRNLAAVNKRRDNGVHDGGRIILASIGSKSIIGYSCASYLFSCCLKSVEALNDLVGNVNAVTANVDLTGGCDSLKGEIAASPCSYNKVGYDIICAVVAGCCRDNKLLVCLLHLCNGSLELCDDCVKLCYVSCRIG